MTDNPESSLLQEFLKSETLQELRLREAVFDEDPNILFEKQCRKDLGIPGLRMDLFFEDSKKQLSS